MSYHGLDILWSFAKDDQFDEGELRPDLIDLLFELPISIRDKVEDSGLLAIVEKWSKKRNHSRYVANRFRLWGHLGTGTTLVNTVLAIQ